VLDQDPSSLPDDIDATVSGLDPVDLRAAVTASAAVLDQVSTAAAQRCATTKPTGMAHFAKAVLAAEDETP
jgi:hypothetical protein